LHVSGTSDDQQCLATALLQLEAAQDEKLHAKLLPMEGAAVPAGGGAELVKVQVGAAAANI
jgi:hypothetical protein